MKHRVKYAAEGLLSGKQVGDQVTFDSADTAHLLALGLIETEDEYEARQAAKAEAEAETQTDSVTMKVSWADLSAVVSPDRIAELVMTEEDRLLEPHKKGGGWYHFGEGAALVKVQGRDEALAELAKREAANVESGQPADGQ